ncbi:MAG: hypothetical protein KDA46_08425 [Parvularculaceae bacterium]|nr:hypothetical protein [Parvularculaceae bacterium]
MRILFSIFLFILGGALIVYSFLVEEVTKAGVVTADEVFAGDIPVVGFIARLIAGGDIPQFTNMLHVGVLVIVLAVVNLMLGRKRQTDDERDSV